MFSFLYQLLFVIGRLCLYLYLWIAEIAGSKVVISRCHWLKSAQNPFCGEVFFLAFGLISNWQIVFLFVFVDCGNLQDSKVVAGHQSPVSRDSAHLSITWSKQLLSKLGSQSCLSETQRSTKYKTQSRHCTAVSAAREVLGIYIVKQNVTHFSAFRQDRKVL